MRIVIRGFGELCITAGLIVLLFVTYTLWGTGRYTQAQQQLLSEQLHTTWRKPQVTTEKVRLGSGIAQIRIPRFGKKYRYVVIEGVDLADLRKGPGHYPGTAMPGEVGNFVISGHRTTYSAPFNRAAELRPGDQVLIDTRRKQYVYKVTGRRVVRPTALEVTAPVPFHPGRRPERRLLTITTCHPKYSAAQRLVIFGELVRELPRVTTAEQG